MKKGNKIVRVDDRQVGQYLKQGFDEISDKGKVLKKATGGKTYSAAEYNKVSDEVDTLKGEVKRLVKELHSAQAEAKKLQEEAAKKESKKK